ncbi:hypothetical protein [Fischerella sp. PCC 9605]|nr:hypothetical protein [Fischerella sp. PCC 9605]
MQVIGVRSLLLCWMQPERSLCSKPWRQSLAGQEVQFKKFVEPKISTDH